MALLQRSGMDKRAPDEGQYRFGPFRLDPAERTLTRDGVPILLTYRVFETLLTFVRSSGGLLTKDELMASIWPGRIVDEGSLTQAIFTLRKALGGAQEEGRYIVTVPGRGYAFRAPVQNAAGFAPAAVIPDVPLQEPVALQDAVRPMPWRSSRHFLAGLCLLAILIAGTAWLMRHRGDTQPVGKSNVVVLSEFQNFTADPALGAVLGKVLEIDLAQIACLERDFVATDRRNPAPHGALGGCAADTGSGAQYLRARSGERGSERRRCCVERSLCGDAGSRGLRFRQERCREYGGGRRQRGPAARSRRDDCKTAREPERIADFDPQVQCSDRAGDHGVLRSPESLFLWRAGALKGYNAAAIPLFRHALELDPGFAVAYEELASAYLGQSEP